MSGPNLVYTLEVTLTDGLMTEEFVAANPAVSRTIQIRTDQTLNQLHRAIFDAFGRWDDCHLCEFNLGTGVFDKAGARYVLAFIFEDPLEYDEDGPLAGSLTETRLSRLGLQVGQFFWYWYDFGDDWQHRITVIAIGEADPTQQYPRVVAQIGQSPPQYQPLEEEEWDHWEDDGYEEGEEILEVRREYDSILDHLPRPHSPLLSSRQMNRLLAPDWHDPASGIHLNRNLTPAEVAGSPFLNNSRIMLLAALDAGGVKTTTAGYLNRAFVKSMADVFQWPAGRVERLWAMNTIRSEKDAYPVHVVRVVLELARLMLRRKGVFRVTRKGEAFLPEARAGELLALLLLTFFQRFNLAYLDRFDNQDFQATVGFSLWGLSQIEPEWYSRDELWPLLIHPAVRYHAPQPGLYDRSQSVLECRLLRPLVWFGLLERMSVVGKGEIPGVEWYRKTPLFDLAFSFDLGPL